MAMAFAKTRLFDEELQKGALLFKALSHPGRMAILRYLSHTRSCMTGDISTELPLSRTTVHQHLKELKEAGLIQGTVDGVRVNYCLDPAGIALLKSVAEQFFSSLNTPEGPECC
jgi:DNA-binding transcriptional ArsR family regulator